MRRIWMILLLAFLLTGCRSIADIKPDTIVDIPHHPTRAQTEPVTEGTELPTETATVPAVTEPTQPTQSHTGSGSKPSGGQKPGQGSTGRKPTAAEPPTAASTEPPAETPTQPPAYAPSGYVPGSLDRAVAEEINGRRQAEGLPRLVLDNGLCALASVRARELDRTWSSVRPDGREGITVLVEYGYGYSAAAENLYYGPADAAAMVDKWMGSKPRRANILMDDAEFIGVGSYTSAEGTTFVAVLFVG